MSFKGKLIIFLLKLRVTIPEVVTDTIYTSGWDLTVFKLLSDFKNNSVKFKLLESIEEKY